MLQRRILPRSSGLTVLGVLGSQVHNEHRLCQNRAFRSPGTRIGFLFAMIVIRQVLLLFKKGALRAIQSPHDGDDELHIAFAIPSAELANWDRSGREAEVGMGRLEPVLSRP
jgi:hypothetical protein